MDRSGTYKSVVIKAVPHAAIVYDKFHIVANYNKAIDKVRRSEWHKADEEHKSFIKGQRYNLFRNPENRKPEQTADLNTLLLLNESLFKAYILKDALKSSGLMSTRSLPANTSINGPHGPKRQDWLPSSNLPKG